jgi:predicted esterase
MIRGGVIVGLLAAAAVQSKPQQKPEAPKEPDDIADVPSKDLRCGKNEKQRYFLIGPRKDVKPPKDGFGLLVVMPGGDGLADFLAFVKRIAKNAAGDGYVVAEPVAVRWTKSQEIIWPTKKNPAAKMEFTTEEFVDAVIADAAKQQKIDPKKVYTLSWSSSGPAAYAIALREKTPVRGSFIAMSVYNKDLLPPIAAAKGRPFYLLHSPDDDVCKFSFAEDAKKDLEGAGAKVALEKYDGGHGWHGPVFPMIKKGIEWLEKQ